jgi:membrane protein implicated in regulation of membrane protease activity
VLAAEATQGARASVRPLSTVTTGGIGNPVLSLGEDGLSATLSFAAIIVPLVALVLVAAIVVLVVWAVRRARRRRPSSTAPLVRP